MKFFHLGVTSEYYSAILNTVVPKEKGAILYTGRLVSAKGIGNLLGAMKVLKDGGMPYKAYIAGDGPDKEKIKKSNVAKNNLECAFSWTDFAEGFSDLLLKGGDICVAESE